MRHRKHKQQLGVKTAHRKALLANLAVALIKHGRIETTLAKAKALRPYIEKLITLAKKGTLHHRRLAIARIRDRSAVKQLFDERAQTFAKRSGGYTRIYKLAMPRIGDAAEIALIEFVGAEDPGHTKKAAKTAKAAAPATAEAKA